MKFSKYVLAAGLLALAVVPAHSGAGVNVGTLTCDVDPGVGYLIGSSKDVVCVYRGNGKTEHYVGSISKLGLDVGVTGNQTVVWAVFAPGSIGKGALAGNYFGASAEASVAIGVGVNALVGGMKKSVTLQPISVSGQTGLSATLAGTALHLTPVKNK
jgi:hypothetical protein